MSERLRRERRIWRPDVDADVDEELRFHLEMRAEQLAARGLPPDEARAEAARRRAEERIAQRQSDQEIALAEAELRRALIRLKVAQLKRNRRQ